jgi:hypothetical protein
MIRLNLSILKSALAEQTEREKRHLEIRVVTGNNKELLDLATEISDLLAEKDADTRLVYEILTGMLPDDAFNQLRNIKKAIDDRDRIGGFSIQEATSLLRIGLPALDTYRGKSILPA